MTPLSSTCFNKSFSNSLHVTSHKAKMDTRFSREFDQLFNSAFENGLHILIERDEFLEGGLLLRHLLADDLFGGLVDSATYINLGLQGLFAHYQFTVLMIVFLLLGLAASAPIHHQLVEMSLLETPKEEVLNQLDELLRELQKDQAMDDSENSKILAKFEAEITILNSQLEVKRNQLKATNKLLGDLGDEVYTISKTASNLQNQLTGLGQRDTDLRNSRANDQAQFEKNSQAARSSINGLQTIINKLTNAVLSASFLEKQEIVDQMTKEMGAKHPLTMLVQVTAKFDKDTVKNIIQKLEHILSQQEQALIRDEQNWDQTQQTYQTLLNEISEVSKRLSFDFSQAQTQLAKKSNEQSIALKRQAQLQTEVPQLEELVRNTEAQREAYSTAYEVRRKKRHEELQTLTRAHQILADKLK